MRRGKDQGYYDGFREVLKNAIIFEKNYFLQKVVCTVRLDIFKKKKKKQETTQGNVALTEQHR